MKQKSRRSHLAASLVTSSTTLVLLGQVHNTTVRFEGQAQSWAGP